MSIRHDASLMYADDYVPGFFPKEKFVTHAERGDVTVAIDTDDMPHGCSLAFDIENDLYLDQLYVERVWMRRGIGTALLKTVLSRAEKEKRRAVTLCTNAVASWNAPYYSRHGFAAAGEEKMPNYLKGFFARSRQHFSPQNSPLVVKHPFLAQRIVMERRVP